MSNSKPGVWRAVHDHLTPMACQEADGTSWHGPVPVHEQEYCRCYLDDVGMSEMKRHGLIAIIATQNRRLDELQAEISRLKGKRRSPGRLVEPLRNPEDSEPGFIRTQP